MNYIEKYYLGNNTSIPFFEEKEFDAMFRILEALFQQLRMDIGAISDLFFVNLGRIDASLDARLLLPIKILAYGAHLLR